VGTRGPLPQSAASAALKGSKARPHKIIKREWRGAPACPKDLTGEAREMWRRVVPELASRGVLAKVDRAALADMCVCWARLQECERDVSSRGLLVPGDRGPVKNPACQLSRQYRQQFQAWARQFGLTPDGRARLPEPEPEPEPNSLSDFLFGQAQQRVGEREAAMAGAGRPGVAGDRLA
jgi:P27 family predicted phage terminase small subunit